jgi:isopentenyl-diphosphate delta-isomerase
MLYPEPQVILVNHHDQAIGAAGKAHAHAVGLLHRAFSVFIFDDNGALMLQQRATDKYHSAALWTNTCCSHPAPAEPTLQAAHRRLYEEMGFDCPLYPLLEFSYQVRFDDGVWEHEYDHVFIGNYNQSPNINTQEVHTWQWATQAQITADLHQNPDKYTHWFALIINKVWDKMAENKGKKSD